MASYGTEQGVEAINSHKAGGYTPTSTPTALAVSQFLEQGYAYLNMALAKLGYSTPVSASAGCYPLLARLNNLFAAAAAEQSTNISTAGPGEETRSDKLWRQFKDELDMLLGGDLTYVGLTLVPTTTTRRNRQVRSLPLRRRDGFAQRYDPDGTEYSGDPSEWLVSHRPRKDY